MQVKYDLSSLEDISGLAEIVDLKELHDYSGITLKGKKLNKSQVRQLRQTIMNWASKSSNYGKIVSDNISNALRKKEAVYIATNDLYASPKKWNFYEPLDDNKKLELMESIETNGILSPIIVWNIDFENIEGEYEEKEIDLYDFQGNKYLILAGHNRADAFRRLYDITKDEEYLKIPAFIFEENEIDIEDARRIVVDTNYVQRTLSTEETLQSILYKYAEVESRPDKKGRTADIVASEMGMSSAKVKQYKRLVNIIPDIRRKIGSKGLNLTAVLKIVWMDIETQKWMYDKYGEVLDSQMINKMGKEISREKIEEIIEKEINKEKVVSVTTKVPVELEKQFKTMVKNWIYNKTKRERD